MRPALAPLLAVLSLTAAPAGAADLSEADKVCVGCHGQEGLSKAFPSGESLPLHVDPVAFAGSVHAPLGCGACHAGIDPKKHPAGGGQTYPTARAWGLAAIEASCRNCHAPIYDAWLGSMHGKARDKDAPLKAPICADCHRPHEVTRVSVGTKLKDTCLTCHSGAPAAHAKWLPNSKRHLDVVACAACHAPAAKRKIDLRFYDAAGRELVGKHGELQPGEPLDERKLWKLMQAANEGGNVRLVGRVEVTTGDQAHAMAERGLALRECTTCHRKGADAFQNVTLSIVGPDGRRVRFEANKEVLSAPTSVESVRGFYAVGGTRIGALDVLLALVLLGGISAPLMHYIVRKLLRKRTKNHA